MFKSNIISLLTILVITSCNFKQKESNITDEKTEIEQKTITTEINKDNNSTPKYFICYKNDTNPDMEISIGFNKDTEAISVKYKGQKEAIKLVKTKESFDKGGAHPTIETYYNEIFEKKENGVYKLTHSGIWDYAEYTRKKDGKKFTFTINHELTIEGGSEYRNTPCF